MDELLRKYHDEIRKKHDEIVDDMFAECGFNKDEYPVLIKNGEIISTKVRERIADGYIDVLLFWYKGYVICVLGMFMPFTNKVVSDENRYTISNVSEWNYEIRKTREEIENEI